LRLGRLRSDFSKDYRADRRVIVFVYSVLVVCSILVHHGFNVFEVDPNIKFDHGMMWTFTAAVCGTMAGVTRVDRRRHRQGDADAAAA
jgi:hypothetical protein